MPISLQHTLRVVATVVREILVLVEDAQMEEHAEQGQRPQRRVTAVAYGPIGVGEHLGQELIRRVIADDQYAVTEQRKAFGQVGAQSSPERSRGGQCLAHRADARSADPAMRARSRP